MGFVRKLTGADGQIKAMKKNTQVQIKAAKEAADAQVRSLNDAANQAAAQQAMLAERQKVESLAADAVSAPMDVADVALAAPAEGASIAATRKRRQQFGQNFGTGVNI